MSTGTELATVPVHKALAGMTGGAIPSLIPQTIDEVWRFSQLLAKSGLTPKGIDTPEQVTVQILMGFDLGLKPMQAVQNIAVINGRPAIGGDLALAILMTSGELEDHDEWIEGEGDARVAICRVQRKGMKPIERRFSVADAKKAGLWQTEPMVRKTWWDKQARQRRTSNEETPNESPWFRYQDRMLCMRARGFAVRDRFADVLKGMHLTEEMIGHEEDQLSPAIAGPSAPPPEEAQAVAPASPVRPALQPAAPPQEVEEAEIVDHPPVAEGGAGAPQEVQEQPETAGAPALAQEDAFDAEAWLAEAGDRFTEAQTTADVDYVHETYGDTANDLLGITERERYKDMHEQAEQRAAVKDHPEAAVITGEPGPPPAEDDDAAFPGDEAINAAAQQKTPGELYLDRIRSAIADPIRTLNSLSGLWTATKAERQQLVNDGHLTKPQVKELHGELMARWSSTQAAPADPQPGPSAPPAEEDEATRYDREFRAKVAACKSIQDIDSLSTSTLAERNQKFTGHPLHKTWQPLVTLRRKELSGIA